MDEDVFVGGIFVYILELVEHEPCGGVIPLDDTDDAGEDEVEPVASADVAEFMGDNHVAGFGDVAARCDYVASPAERSGLAVVDGDESITVAGRLVAAADYCEYVDR